MSSEVIQGFRLSPQQRRLWLLQQEDAAAYRGQSVLLMEGHIQPHILRDSLEMVVQRHEILRTVFQQLRGVRMPVQVVLEGSTPVWRNVDLSGLAPQQQEVEVAELLEREARRPLDFESSPLVSALLITLAVDRRLLAVTLPALCADSVTLNNLAHEIAWCYAGCVQGEMPTDEPLQYTQFSEWQNDLLEDDDAIEGKKYWRKQDLSAQIALMLPALDRAAGDGSFEPVSLPVAMGDEETRLVASIAERYGVTVSTVFLSIWQALLWRLIQEPQITIGSMFESRDYEALQGTFGLFARSLPIPCQLADTLAFVDLLLQTDALVSAATGWQDYFLWEDQESINRGFAKPPFLPFGFQFEHRPVLSPTAGVSLSIYKQHVYTERFHIKLSCVRTGDSLIVELCYDATLLNVSDARRLAEQFRTLLKSVIAHPEARIGQLEVLGATEREQLLIEWNQTKRPSPPLACLHHLFEAQADRTPSALALSCGDEHLTYRELEMRANQLARQLRRAGVRAEVVVAIMLERGVELVVALLGVLKAGGAYLPLDATYPPERLAFMLEDAGVRVLLTQSRLHGLVRQLRGEKEEVRVIEIDEEQEAISKQSEERVESPVRAENLAYVIYTSGSTGRPKGVMIEHRSVVNLAMGLREAIYVKHVESLKVSLNAPVVFDGSVKQLVQLVSGHSLHIVPERLRTDAEGLLSFIDEQSLDVLDCTPSHLRLLLADGLTGHARHKPSVVLVGGEAIDRETWKLLAESAETDFYNVYGPTECTVNATVCRVRTSKTTPTIGRPIANVKIYLLNDNLEPVPIGATGEIHIGGDGLARGYLNRPALTGERFVPNPFADQPGGRLYRTGDLGCYLSDGRIKFAGRNDLQVKLRGFRIEPGEIEARLREHSGVREAVVIVRNEATGDDRLNAYVTARQTSVPGPFELRQWLRGALPEYMVPSTFTVLQNLPLTRSGKIDRGALPEPESVRQKPEARYLAPRDEIEQKICAVWQELLGVEKISIEENFFDLGGHSLLMVQAHGKLREIFKKDISIVEMFKNPSIKSLAEYFSEGTSQELSFKKVQGRVEKRQKAARRGAQIVKENSQSDE